MSLKAVHLFFVIALSAMSFGCAVWKVRTYASPAGTPKDLVFAGAALLTTILVIFYGRYFLKKLRAIGYI
jgi:hypothetical protein